MNKTELFDKKVKDLFGETDSAEWEFLNKYIFRGIDYSKGLNLTQLKNSIMELLAFNLDVLGAELNIRIIGIETYDHADSLYVFNWEDYSDGVNKEYEAKWLVRAVNEISSLKGSRSFIYVTISQKVLNKYL